jgi:hypothetical protein
MEKFEKGKWYKNNKGYFGKYLNSERCEFRASERKLTSYKNKGTYAFNSGYTWKEASVEELNKFLPDGHPDKISESWCVKVTKENMEVVKGWMKNADNWIFDTQCYYGIKKGSFTQYGHGTSDYFDKVISTEEFYKKIGYTENNPKSIKEARYIVMNNKSMSDEQFTFNYIFKVNNENDNRFSCEYDCRGNTKNGWVYKWFRTATPDEIKMYEDAGVPVDVTKYKCNNKSSINKSKTIKNEGQSIKIKRIVSNVSRGDRPRGTGFFNRRSVTASRCGHNSYEKRAVEC